MSKQQFLYIYIQMNPPIPQEPWFVKTLYFDHTQKRLSIFIDKKRGTTFECTTEEGEVE